MCDTYQPVVMLLVLPNTHISLIYISNGSPFSLESNYNVLLLVVLEVRGTLQMPT